MRNKLAKILVIEDEVSLRKLVEVNLIASGYQVSAASSGEEGLKLAQKKQPELILLDLKLPGMSGWDVLLRLKNDHTLGNVKVIIMTAVVPRENQFPEMKTAGYLIKPFNIDTLLRQVGQVLGE